MNRNKLKQYAPQARRDFIAAVTDRAAYYGLTKQHNQPITEQGDVALIGGKPFPRHVAEKRKRLEGHIKQQGFEQVMEAMAYTWFNRLVAIRFMELHGYLDHGYRLLSHPEGKPTPEILEHAEHVDLPELKKETVINLKLAGNKEGELYRLLLTAQCNALHTAMPFLFEKIDDETELLLPDNLLHSDSLIRKLVREIDKEDWQEVEIIGWLYQFYISERKSQVIGKVVASEDIPAATQLFTPNWIVKYLVQNTLGRQWLATYPQSALRQQMEYYIEPAEQTPEVQKQLKAITPTSLNPEELTLLDPACGSGHILVEAYDLFKAIYQERGYRARDIPALILQKNLFGLEIDDRAAQLAALTLMMKARADDRRIFDSEAKPNILAFQDSRGMDAADITHALNAPINKEDVPSENLFEEIEEETAGLFSKKALAEQGHVSQGDIASLLALFENAKTFGSLIQVPPKLAEKLPEIEQRLYHVLKYGDLTHASAHVLKPLVQQARLLTRQYAAVVANPPYMGNNAMHSSLKAFLRRHYPAGKTDTFAAFIGRCLGFCSEGKHAGLVTPFVWMFLSSYEELRRTLLSQAAIASLLQLEYNAFEPACVPVCAFIVLDYPVASFSGTFIKLSQFKGHETQSPRTLEAIRNPQCDWRFAASTYDFEAIPGAPISFWLSKQLIAAFRRGHPLSAVASPKHGMTTGNVSEYTRRWWEVSVNNIDSTCRSRHEAIESPVRWFPYNKGGSFRKWYGNNDVVVDYGNGGERMSRAKAEGRNPGFRHDNYEFFFKPSLTWSDISSSFFGVRVSPPGYVFDNVGPSLFCDDDGARHLLAGLLCSRVSTEMMMGLNPTMHFLTGNVSDIPVVDDLFAFSASIQGAVEELVSIAKADWDSMETSSDMLSHPLLVDRQSKLIEAAFERWQSNCNYAFTTTKRLEEQVNEQVNQAYGVKYEIPSAVSDEAITLHGACREDDMKSLISYAIGCMMGRYTLDKTGLIYAHSGNQGFDSSQYKTFRADEDGIIPLLETDWGIRDDASNRIVEFISVAWPKDHLEENLKFIADSLGPNNGEQPCETIRRYLATGFYKHHLSMYKKRPIYWLFSSGKERTFQCLVYLHRYHEGTLSRMRIEYVIPLQGKISSRIGQLGDDIAAASSTSHRKKLEKERDTLVKQQAELRTFDEKLRHYADLRISLDLDDGVKVNYGKFGDLLAEVKAVSGGTMDAEL